MPQKIEISSRTIIFTVFFLIALRVLWLVRGVIYALFLAFIFMSALKPFVNGLERRSMPRAAAAFVVFVATLIGFGFAFVFLLPPLVDQSVIFLKDLPVLLSTTFPTFSQYLSSDSIVQFLPDITGNFVRIAGGVFSSMVFIISMFFFTFYFLLEEKFLKAFLERFLEKRQANQITEIATKVEKRMGAWVWGQVVLMTVIGVLTYIGLAFLQVKFALSLAFVAGLLEVVPFIGPTIALIPAFIVASSTSFMMGWAVLAFYFIIQQLENNLVVPMVMKRAVGLHPIVTLIALSIGGKLGGLLGVILSVPAALLIETVLVELSKAKR